MFDDEDGIFLVLDQAKKNMFKSYFCHLSTFGKNGNVNVLCLFCSVVYVLKLVLRKSSLLVYAFLF
jgi:hypothetical protein